MYQRYVTDLVNSFAGRIYEGQPSRATNAFRKMLERERDSSYLDGNSYSIPFGSRYHPERAPLWAPESLVEGAERWILEGLRAGDERSSRMDQS